MKTVTVMKAAMTMRIAVKDPVWTDKEPGNSFKTSSDIFQLKPTINLSLKMIGPAITGPIKNIQRSVVTTQPPILFPLKMKKVLCEEDLFL
jgi:hypothetical protein